MSEDPQQRWLPPQAPGGSDPARWDEHRAQPAPPPPTPPPSVSAEPASPPAPGDAATPQATNTLAMASLVLGIAGLVLFVFPGGLGLAFFFNLPCSILAWVFGVQAQRKVDRGEALDRRSMAHTGMVLGIVGVVLGVLAIIAWTLAIALDEEFRDRLERQLNRD